ncbi:MAG: LamG-like jellyroll fold domain-containing protein [Verrucomicrobiota bacterium]
MSTYLGQLRVGGAAAVADGNVRVVQHGAMGTVVIPQSPTFQPLQVFSGPHFTGTAMSLSQYIYYRTTQLGALSGKISSFKLKRGYMATLAQNQDGTGLSRNYVAQDGDMEVSVLPGGLDDNVRFVYVAPWRWVAKKGSCDILPGDVNATWWYNWNISSSSSRDIQYVAIKQQPYWPGLNQDWQALGVNHLSGYNEPNNPVEDAYKNLTPPGSVSDAVARWPELLATGLRVGAPGVSDSGYSWIADFVNQAEAAGYRIDYVPIHYYRSYWNNADPANAANQLYDALKGVYDAVKRPLWLTEFNNGANWTSDADPTFDQNKNVIEAMINKMDGTPWIERYSVYSAVEEVRQVYYNAGGLTPMGVMYRDHVSPLAYLQGLQSNGTRSFAQLRFETNTLDTSGNGNNGITTGTPAYASGHSGQALVFDGANTKVTLPPNIATGNAFTFAAWIYWKGGANWQRIFDFGNSTTQYLFLTPSSGNGTLRFAILNGGAEQIVESAALAQNQWRHVAVTLSGNTARLYVNGVQVAVNTSLTLSPASFSPRVNFLGASQFPDPLFNGLMDELLITDYALSAGQIAALQTNTPPQFTSGSLTRSTTGTDVLYFDTVAGTAVAANPGGKITYAKTTGPNWLSVSADGVLGGVPTDANLGTNAFTVQASDSTGLSAFTLLTVVVTNSPKMIARLDFEGNTGSSVGSAHGILTGPASYVVGQSGQAIDLDGTTNYITLPPGVANADDFTVAAWVNWDGGGAWQRVFDFGNSTSDNLFLTPSSGSNMRFSLVVGGVGQDLNAAILPTGSWQHVVVTHSGNIGRMYLNGAQVAINTLMTFKPSNFNPARNYIGKSQWPDPLFNGRVDAFCIYNYALSADAVAALYTNTPPAFSVNPITLPSATPDQLYSGTIAGLATSALGPVTYSKIGGPDWLKVGSDGLFSGTPHPANAGPNAITVRATDLGPTSTDATMLINVVPATGAIGIFGFERNILNTVGVNHGTAIGSPAYVAGVNGRAINFDGVDDYVTLPSGMMNVNDLTVAVWVYWNGSGGLWQRVFDFGNNTTQYMFLTPSSPSGKLRFAIITSGSANEQTLEAPAVPANQWTHVAVTLQGGTTGKLYVNGSLAASNSITLRPSSINPTVNYLGKSQWPGDALLNGRLDDLQIYNRALAPTEIAGLANPNRYSDLDGLMFSQTVQPGEPLTISVSGIAGRIYTLWRSQSLTSPWSAVLTNGPVVTDGPVMLADPAPPTDGAFYRTSVSMP